MTLQEEITRRRTFAVIAHPDAGKTTLTEKLLLFGGAIHVAGAVKSNKIKKGATSDFMEIERQRGISVATAVMGFEYKGTKINILDTPGHEDFAEDTYRTHGHHTACRRATRKRELRHSGRVRARAPRATRHSTRSGRAAGNAARPPRAGCGRASSPAPCRR